MLWAVVDVAFDTVRLVAWAWAVSVLTGNTFEHELRFMALLGWFFVLPLVLFLELVT